MTARARGFELIAGCRGRNPYGLPGGQVDAVVWLAWMGHEGVEL